MSELDNNNRPITRTYTVHISPELAGKRLDRALTDAMADAPDQGPDDMSRARIQSLLGEGQVALAGHPGMALDAKRKTREGDVYTINVPAPAPAVPQPEDIPLDVVYEDDDLVVIDKEPGMVVHPAAGNYSATLVNALLHHCKGSLSGIGGVARPGIVHRLDKGTGGLIVAAKNDNAHNSLSRQFSERSIERGYYALVWGVPVPASGEIEGNIKRSERNRKKMAISKSAGKYAKTAYRTIRSLACGVSLVECRLATGRTHQIRVHMTSIGHPLLGDGTYGSARRLPGGISIPAGVVLLYAYKIGFIHPRTGEKMLFEKKLPSYFNELIEQLEKV